MRSTVMPSRPRGSGIAWPITRTRATPPSGKIDIRTWVKRSPSATGKVLWTSPRRRDLGTICIHCCHGTCTASIFRVPQASPKDRRSKANLQASPQIADAETGREGVVCVEHVLGECVDPGRACDGRDDGLILPHLRFTD